MDKIYDKCCGVDVYKKIIVAYFKQGSQQEVREFGATTRKLLESILSGKQIDSAEYDILYEKKVIAHNLEATKEQIIDDLNGVMSDQQKKTMYLLLKHHDELNDGIDNFMKPEEKKAAIVTQNIPGIGNNSAQAIISVIGTDMRRFQRVWI